MYVLYADWLCIASVTIETVLSYNNFIVYKALTTDGILVKTWTLSILCHTALVPMS